MTDDLTTTEKNSLKWVIFHEYYRKLGETHTTAQERYFKLDGFLKVLGANDEP